MTPRTTAPDLTEARLRELAGERSFARGRAYVDAVSAVEVRDDRIRASVAGTERYTAELTLGRRGLAGECDCPYGQEGNFCKHLVAVGLTVLSTGFDLPRRRARSRDRARGLDTWLAALPHAELLALVREEAAENHGLRRRLELRAASARQDLTEVRSLIRDLLDLEPFTRQGWMDPADARAYVDQAGQAVAAIRSLTGSGRAADAVTLAREGIGLLTGTTASIDDEDGRLAEIGAGLAHAHHEACRAARPDPDELARWLVTHALRDEAELTGLDPLDYTDVLGDRGTTALRERAIEAWKANRGGWPEKYLIQRLTKTGRDADMVIALHAADLAPNGHTHLLIARELEASGRPEEALEWAERGIREAENLATVDTALIDHLSDRYTRADRPADAAALRRDHFTARPSLLTYQQLRATAQVAGHWPAERERALALLRTANATVLLAALLDDKDTAAAWQTATESGASAVQWTTLADQLRPTRPADSLTIYQRLATPLTHQTGTKAYTQLVALLLSIRDCHQRLGTQNDFTLYTAALRTAQKRKRNLIALLDEHGL
ncbi:hypothetical protein KUM39_02550 [Streptomyces sp. J2-1]|uniref:SWIM zinc finger family protein n=1 Tax=Streptomyces corallincola TaxID=2851888 RepID=UPI001C37FBDF|nr:SWIM zinc finger family protein [Streptomyces corallincola]MBV2353251.1 hypothetical protein [Streptomyces corallincola]